MKQGIMVLLVSVFMFVSCTYYESSDIPRIDTDIKNESTKKINNVVGKLNGNYIKVIVIEQHEFYYIYNWSGDKESMVLVHRPDCRRCKRGM